MARNNRDWDDLGRSVQDIIDRAVNSHDYQQLNETIRQVVDVAMDLGGEALRKVKDASARPSENYDQPQQPFWQEKTPALYGKTSGHTASGVLKIVGGGLLSCVTLALTIVLMGSNLWYGWPLITPEVVVMLLGFGGSAGLLCSGIRTLSRLGRFKTYRKMLGQKTHIALEKLSRAVGKSVDFVRREVRWMTRRGLFLEGHLDNEQTELITSDETFRHYEQSRLQMEERKRLEAAEKAQNAAMAKQAAKQKNAPAKPEPEAPARDPRVQEVLDKGNAFIAEIRRCNDAIPGEEISGKIDRMETIVRRIFQRAEEHPEIVPDLKKLMDYYLPMTVKLLNAYADMDAQPAQGETIQNSKREIEDVLDTLNAAFEKLLDELFKDTAMDVSSDISVLTTLLAQEGLTEDELDKLKKETQGS